MSNSKPIKPEVSIVIPVYNERAIVADSVAGLLDRLPDIVDDFEIILAENGSTDGTLEVVADLERRHPEVRHIHVDEPNYGRALKQGILSAKGKYLICDEIDLCNTDFYRSSLGLMRRGLASMVIGSKLAPGAQDERPWLRHLASVVFSEMLRMGVGFKGTDTHGLKAFVREEFLDVVDQCVVEQNLFASEFVIRAEKTEREIVELPLCIREKRTPSINLFRRVPRALYNLGRLVWLIRIRG
jgi:glycosyltransferase involved in cell wall biosynthesis